MRRDTFPLWIATGFIILTVAGISVASGSTRGTVVYSPTTIHLQPGQQVTVIADNVGPACSVSADGVVRATGLVPGVNYAAWWEITLTAGGTILASSNLHDARPDGTLPIALDDHYHGTWEIYVRSETQPNYSETDYTAKCEWTN